MEEITKPSRQSSIELLRAAFTLGGVIRIAHEYEAVLPDEARELLSLLAERGKGAVDWSEDAETADLPQAPPWEPQWIVERWIDTRGQGTGRWAHVTTIETSSSEAEAFDRATDEWTGFRGRDYGRTWRAREVGDLEAKRAGGAR
jgi:hypothetical protein